MFSTVEQILDNKMNLELPSPLCIIAMCRCELDSVKAVQLHVDVQLSLSRVIVDAMAHYCYISKFGP